LFITRVAVARVAGAQRRSSALGHRRSVKLALVPGSARTIGCPRRTTIDERSAIMPGPGDSGSLEFEKVSLDDARKALDETGPAAYAVQKKPENWEEKRTPTSTEPLNDETAAWLAELPEAVRPRQLALRYARLANRLCKVWREPLKCERLLDDLMTDRRGGRKGFPLQVASELATLRDHYFRLNHAGKSAWEHVEMGR
jgi:hypothetical protein